MSDKTTYVVETEYKVKDDASHGLEKIGHAADEAHEHSESLRDVLKEVGETFLIFEGVEKAKELFVGFNAELQTTKVQLQAVLGAQFKKSWNVAGEAADEFYEGFEKFAEEFPTSIKEMSENARTLGVAVSQAGGSMEDLKELTERGAIAEKLFGLNAHQMMGALEGRLQIRSAGGAALAGLMHVTPEEWKKYTKEARLSLMKHALESETITKGGEAFANTFASQASILKDRLEVAAGKVGLPLFQALNKELKGWNEWLTKNSEKIEEISHKIAEGLVTGFGYLKDVAGFLYDHSSVLIKIAEAWAAVKIGGALGSIGKSITNPFAKIGDSIEKLVAMRAVGSHDSFNKETGAYEFVAAQKAAGLRQQLGAGLGVIGAAAPFAAAAGEILGEQLGNAVYPGVRRLKEMEESVKIMDERFREAQEAASKLSGALGSAAAGRLQANINEDADRIKALREALDINVGAGPLGYGGKMKRERILKEAGYDTGEIESLGGDMGMSMALGGEMFKQQSRQTKLNQVTSSTDNALKIALGTMHKNQREHINMTRATNMIMEKQLRENRFMSPDEVKKFLLENKEIQEEQAKINQTVNVTIQQVSAKDPDRWIADMDDYAARRVRSRTKARGALARGH